MTSVPLPDVAAIAERARAAGRLGLDTEFVGEGRYRTLLCLVQIALPDGEVVLLDPLDERLDPTPLASVIADPRVELVVHAGRQDVALVRRWLKTDVTNLFDTQIAAAFAGLAAQASYDHLLSEMLDLKIGKSASFTRWERRPLSEEQLHYAREDVVHLLELADALEKRLNEQARMEWVREECAIIARSSDERDTDSVFARLPRIRGLRGESRSIARELVDWREERARSADRTVQSVLADAVLVEVAKRRPSSVRDLEQVRGVHPAQLRRRGQEILAAVERGRTREVPPLDAGQRVPAPNAVDAPIIALCEALVRARSRRAAIAYELLTTRADLQAIVEAWRRDAEPPPVRALTGWRRELVGEDLMRLLAGELSLRVNGDRRLEVR